MHLVKKLIVGTVHVQLSEGRAVGGWAPAQRSNPVPAHYTSQLPRVEKGLGRGGW